MVLSGAKTKKARNLLLVVFFLACWGPRKTFRDKKKEATDAYANWIYITIAHSAPSPRKERAHHRLCIYTRWVDAHRCLHPTPYWNFLGFNKSESDVSKRLSYYNRADQPIGAAQLIAGNQRKDQVQSYIFFSERARLWLMKWIWIELIVWGRFNRPHHHPILKPQEYRKQCRVSRRWFCRLTWGCPSSGHPPHNSISGRS